MMEEKYEFVFDIIRCSLTGLKSQRLKKQIELDCLSNQIDDLENMLFKIEIEIEQQKE